MTQPIVVQQPFKLAGKGLLPGHVIPDEQFSAIPEKNQQALLSQGLVTRDASAKALNLTPGEKVAAKALKKARDAESAASTRLSELHEKRKTLEKGIEDLRVERGQMVADDGDENKIKALRDQIAQRTQELEDTLEGIHAAIERAGKADRAREAAEREFTLSSVDRLVAEHGVLCDKLQETIEKELVPLILEYRKQSLAFGRTLGETANRQLHHDWRLKRILAPILGETVRPKDRISSFRELEEKLWRNIAGYASRKEPK
jgi:hypothetical protein